MCGIVGYSAPEARPSHIHALQALISEAAVRGLHAFGFTASLDGALATGKYHSLQCAKEALGAIWCPQVRHVIYHNRYSTSGDYADHANNQPIVVGDMALAYNGIVDMGTKAEREARYGETYTTDNDGETVVRLLLRGDDPVSFLKAKATFAGLWCDGTAVYVLRNARRPLWTLTLDDAVFVASTQDIFHRALGADCSPVTVPPNRVWVMEEVRGLYG